MFCSVLISKLLQLHVTSGGCSLGLAWLRIAISGVKPLEDSARRRGLIMASTTKTRTATRRLQRIITPSKSPRNLQTNPRKNKKKKTPNLFLQASCLHSPAPPHRRPLRARRARRALGARAERHLGRGQLG